MSKPAVQELIKSNVTIPTLPEVVLRISEMMADPNSGTAEIGALVAEDAPLAAKVLRIANSAYYGLSGECVSTSHASTVLGVRVLKNIVTQASVINLFDHLEDPDFSMDELWRHAILTAHLCSKLGSLGTKILALTPDELYVCGLLHDVGKVIMLDGLGRPYVELYKAAREKDVPLFKLERSELDFTHCDVGAVVAARWDLPEKVARTIQYHHGPRERVAEDVLVSAVAHANLLAHRVADGESPAAIEGTFDSATREQLGLNQAAVNALIDFAEEHKTVELP